MKWGSKVSHKIDQQQKLFESSLYNEQTFYNKFVTDLQSATKEVIIESPYITTKRLKTLLPIFTHLKSKKVAIFIITRDPREHDKVMAIQSELGIRWFENMGIQVLLEDGGHHRKLAIIDRKILWEGSLNILSQNNSREIMRRINSTQIANQLVSFLSYPKNLK